MNKKTITVTVKKKISHCRKKEKGKKRGFSRDRLIGDYHLGKIKMATLSGFIFSCRSDSSEQE